MIRSASRDHALLDRQALVGEAVGAALVQPAHPAQRVERHHERHAEGPLHVGGDQAGHEEIRVDQVVRAARRRQASEHACR